MMITDNASQHKTKRVRRYQEQNPDVRILYLPVARPESGAIGETWGQARYQPITSELYRTLDDLRRAVSEHFRTCSVNVDIHTHLARGARDEIIFGRRYIKLERWVAVLGRLKRSQVPQTCHP